MAAAVNGADDAWPPAPDNEAKWPLQQQLLANPALKPRLERACRLRGVDLPVLCTPKSLLGG